MTAAASCYDAAVRSLQRSSAGRPQLLRGEVQVAPVAENAKLHEASAPGVTRCRVNHAALTVTTHRLLFDGGMDPASGERSSVCIALADIAKVEAVQGRGIFMKGSSRVAVFLKGQPQTEFAAVEVSIKQGRKETLHAMCTALQREAWVVETASDVVSRYAGTEEAGRPAEEAGPRLTGVGVAGILARQELKQKVTAQIATDAFADLDSLMEKAKEVVAIMERYAGAVEQQKLEGDSQGDAEAGEASFEALVQSMGFISAVTEKTAGGKTRYHGELARQFADFLTRRAVRGGASGDGTILGHFGGMMTLIDAYSVFNRARGTSLVSPDDLMKACSLLNGMNVGVRLRKLDSGVIVLQSDAFDDRRIGEELQSLATDARCIIETQVAKKKSVSLLIAREQLLQSEKLGYLCRDESIEGVRFFPNLFPSFAGQ